MDATTNALNWFELPAEDITRAKSFYETVFGINMQQMDMMGMQMLMFPWKGGNGKVGGALVKSDMHQPSLTGAIIYLNADPDLETALNKVEGAGGRVIMPKTLIDEQTGYMAFFVDTEGNRVGLHSNG